MVFRRLQPSGSDAYETCCRAIARATGAARSIGLEADCAVWSELVANPATPLGIREIAKLKTRILEELASIRARHVEALLSEVRDLLLRMEQDNADALSRDNAMADGSHVHASARAQGIADG